MKGLWLAVGSTLILLALSWGLLERNNADMRAADGAMAAFNEFVAAENGLHRAVLSARAGSLRNYDPLVRELGVMHDALERLREATPTEMAFGAEADTLAVRTEDEEALVERFKSTNALLQNSLAYFTRLNSTINASGTPAGRNTDRLATVVLHLVVDPAPASLVEVDEEIARIEPVDPAREARLAALVAHARQLRLLQPEMDATLAALAAIGSAPTLDAVRGTLLARQATITARGNAVRILLYGIALVLVALLAWAGLQLRARVNMLRRRAAIEHVVATISLRFLNTPSWRMEAHLERALEELALCFGATRAYFIVPGPPVRAATWASGGPPLPPRWFEEVVAYMEASGLRDGGIVHIEDARSGTAPSPAKRAGLGSWLCIARIGTAEGGACSVLGFDSTRPGAFRESGADQLLALAFDALTNAVLKSGLEEERERLEAQLQHARRMETMGVFATGIAHNFNNIIGAIMGHAELAAAGAGDRRLAGHIEAINVAAERAHQLVDQILGFGRRSESLRRPIRVDRLIAETASLLATSLGPHALVVAEAQDPLVVQADAGQVQQILLNLCRNAAEAMDRDGTIAISTRAVHLPHPRTVGSDVLARGEHVVIAVEDDGRGIDEATLARVFEPFFTTRHQGSGLGLATALEIAREHRGTIAVASTPGAGSRFELWLPAAPGGMAAVEDSASTAPERGAGETVLLVEPDEEQRMRQEEVLAALGYEPVAFADCERAVAAARAAPSRFDAAVIFAGRRALLCTDDLGGLHAAVPRIPIILSVEAARQPDAERLTHAGITEVIPYPPTSARLAEVLATRLRARRDPPARLMPD